MLINKEAGQKLKWEDVIHVQRCRRQTNKLHVLYKLSADEIYYAQCTWAMSTDD